MEELKVNKSDLLAAYHAGNSEQKAVLEKLYGKEVFAYDWREITSYEKPARCWELKLASSWK